MLARVFLTELNFYVPLIRGLEQGKGAVMEVLTSLQHRAALLMVPTELEELTWQLIHGLA